MKNRNTARYKAILIYDGTSYHGSQRQKQGIRTIQGEVEKVLRQLDWKGKSILMAGRTDAGVHARGQVIAFDLEWNHPSINLLRAANAMLPRDIALKEIEEVEADFHPRYHALARRYLYRIYCSPSRDPMRDRYTWHVWPNVSLEALRKAARDLVGIHDFQAFGSPHKPGGSTVRDVKSASWDQQGDELTFEIVGNAFLYHMVRHIVQILIEVGQEKQTQHAVKAHLAEPDQAPAQGLAPARGLCLMDVMYK